MSDEERAKKRKERIKAAQSAKKDNDRKNAIVKMMSSKMFEYGEQCLLITGCAIDDDKTPSSIALLEKRMLIFSGGDYAKDNADAYYKVDIPYEDIRSVKKLVGQSAVCEIVVFQGGETSKFHIRYVSCGSDEFINKLNECAKIGNGNLGYHNVCWKCHAPISSDGNDRCPKCKMFICYRCGACFCNKTS